MTAEAESPTTTYIVTVHELAFLLQRFASPGVDLCRSRLGFDGIDVSDTLVSAGAATMQARGMADLVEDQIVPTGAAAALSYALIEAKRWLEFAFLNVDEAWTHSIIDTGDYAFLLTPSLLGNFRADALTVDGTLPETVARMTDVMLRGKTDCVFLLRIHTPRESRVFVVVIDADGAWSIGSADASDPAGFSDPVGVSEDEAMAAMFDILEATH